MISSQDSPIRSPPIDSFTLLHVWYHPMGTEVEWMQCVQAAPRDVMIIKSKDKSATWFLLTNEDTGELGITFFPLTSPLDFQSVLFLPISLRLMKGFYAILITRLERASWWILYQVYEVAVKKYLDWAYLKRHSL